MKSRFFLIVMSFVLFGCAQNAQIIVRTNVPPGAEMAVVMFQDCMISGQEDCDGSGNTAGSIFASAISLKNKYLAVPVSRPVGPKTPVTDDSAVALAKAKGFKYVVNGEVTEFYSVAPMTFRVDRAGVAVRVLKVEDGSVVAFFTHKKDAITNLATPHDLLQEMAESLADSL